MTLDLTELKKRFQPRSVLALTIEADRIVASLVQRENGSVTPLPLVISVTTETLLAKPEQAGNELAAALHSAGIREHQCAVCLPPSWALSTSTDLPETNLEDLRGYFELRAERDFSTAVADLQLSHCAYTLPDGQQRATLAGVPAKRMDAVKTMLLTAGCRPVSLSLALPGCLSEPGPTLHLLANGDQTDAVVSCGGGIAVIRTLATSGSDPGAFAREIRITLGRLPESIHHNLRHARLVGPRDAALRESLARIGFDNIIESDATTSGAAAECAERTLHEQPVPFEFLVPEVSRWPALIERFNTRRGRQIAVGAFALILLPLFVFIYRSHKESRLEAEWNTMKNTVADVEGLQQKIRQFRPWFEPEPQKLQAFSTLVVAFPEKGDVWTRSVQIGAYLEKSETGARSVPSATASKVTVSGFARSNSVLLGLQERLRKQPGVSALQLQQYRGNNPVQFSLSYKWESKHE